MKRFKFVLLTCLTLCLSNMSFALNINRYVKVGGTGKGTSWEDACGSIQKAIDNCKLAGSGTVHIAAGTYYEKITVEGEAHDIYILGGYPANGGDKRDYKNKTIVDGKSRAYCIFVRHSENINVDGIVAINGKTGNIPFSELGTAEHGGIGYNYASGTISNCVASNCNGYGFLVGERASKSVLIRDCVATKCEGGFSINQHTIKNCTAAENRQIGIFTRYGEVLNCSSFGNKGVGVRVENAKVAFSKIYNNENLEAEGGGVYMYGDATIYGCEIFNNTAAGGGGIYSTNSENCVVIACTIVNNMSLTEGAGILTEYYTRHIMSGNILWNNKLKNGTPSQFLFKNNGAKAGSTLINSAVQGGGELPETDALNGIIDVAKTNDMPGKPSVKFTKVCNIVGASLMQSNIIAGQDFSLQDGSACLRTGKPLDRYVSDSPFDRRIIGKEYYAFGINGEKRNPNVSNCGAWQLVKTDEETKPQNVQDNSTAAKPSAAPQKTVAEQKETYKLPKNLIVKTDNKGALESPRIIGVYNVEGNLILNVSFTVTSNTKNLVVLLASAKLNGTRIDCTSVTSKSVKCGDTYTLSLNCGNVNKIFPNSEIKGGVTFVNDVSAYTKFTISNFR